MKRDSGADPENKAGNHWDEILMTNTRSSACRPDWMIWCQAVTVCCSHKGELLAGTSAPSSGCTSSILDILPSPGFSLGSSLGRRGESMEQGHFCGVYLCFLHRLIKSCSWSSSNCASVNHTCSCWFKSLLTICINSLSEKLKSSTATKIKMIPLCRTVKMTGSHPAQHSFKWISDSRLALRFPNTAIPALLLSPARTLSGCCQKKN